jgi:hypothetical protein
MFFPPRICISILDGHQMDLLGKRGKSEKMERYASQYYSALPESESCKVFRRGHLVPC